MKRDSLKIRQFPLYPFSCAPLSKSVSSMGKYRVETSMKGIGIIVLKSKVK